MKKAVLFVLTLSGLSAVASHVFREYHYVKTLKTWAEAQSYCRETFTDLATVDNQDHHDRLLSVLQQGLGEYAWIGLYDDLIRWKWALGNADFNNDTDFSNWRLREPNNMHSKENCTVMILGGRWLDIPCQRLQQAVCYNEQGPSMYILVKNNMTWEQAVTYCRSNYTDLASVRNMSENNQISSLLTKPVYTWIGLQRKLWASWSDQTTSTFTNWEKGQPDNSGNTVVPPSCAAVNTTTGTWWDIDCEAKHYFICHNVLSSQYRTFKLKFQSETDLNDPAVQKEILEQIHAKFEKYGLPDVNLTWIKREGQTFLREQKKEGSSG